MRTLRPLALSLFLVALAAGRTVFAGSSDRLDGARDQAMEAYHAERYDEFVARMEAIAAQSTDATDDYNLACGYSLNGQLDEALERLRYLVDSGATPDLVDDEDFRPLRARPEFYQLVARAAFQEEADRRLEPVRSMAMEKYGNEEYGVFVEIMERVASVSNSDIDLYNLACGYALTGRSDEAISALERLADRSGDDYGAAGDEDFASLRNDPRFRAAVARLSD